MANDSTVDPSTCAARTMYNRPCDVPVLPGNDVCEEHAIARTEYENWWEWDDDDAAEEFRQMAVRAARDALLGVGVPVDADEPRVLQHGDQEYSVLSATRGGLRYTVAFDPQPEGTAIYECRCRGWFINRRCSHIDQVTEFIGPDALPQKLPEWAESRGQCSEITSRGTQCRNTAMEGESYCHQHLPKVEAPSERVRCQATTQAGQQCQNLAHRGLVFCNRHRDPDARCPALNLRGTQCNWDKLEGQDFCQYHVDAREEGWNWWEWDDEAEADAFREEMLAQAQQERADEMGLGARTVVLRVEPEEPESVSKRTPWWRRWWMIIIWVILFIMACSAAVGGINNAAMG